MASWAFKGGRWDRVLLALMAAFSVVLAAVCVRNDLPWTDSCWYHLMGAQMARHSGPFLFAGDEVMVPAVLPGYPLILAFLYKCVGIRIWAAGLLNVVAFGAIVMLMGRMASRLGGPVAGGVSAAVLAWTLPLRTLVGSIMSDPISCAIWAFFFWHVSRSLQVPDRPQPRRPAFLLGALAGLAVLMRPTNGLFIPCVALWLWLVAPRRALALVQFALGGLPFALTLLLWNRAVSGDLAQLTPTLYSAQYHPQEPLFSIRHALPNPSSDGIEKILGHFLIFPYMLAAGGQIAGQGFAPMGILALFSIPLWIQEGRSRLVAVFLACVVAHWIFFSFYLYSQERFYLPAFLGIVLLAQPMLQRLLNGASRIPWLGPISGILLTLAFLGPAVERGSRESVSGKGSDKAQASLCQWIQDETEQDAVFITGWQLLVQYEAQRTAITYWDALDREGEPVPLIASSRPLYVQMDWYASHMWGQDVLKILRQKYDWEELEGPGCRFLKRTAVRASLSAPEGGRGQG